MRYGLIAVLVLASPVFSAEDVRRTPAVVAVEKTYPCVAAVYVQKDGRLISGSGTVIDPRGYVLTASHILGGPTLVLLPDRPPLKARTVASLPERDLAILEIGDLLWKTGPRAKPDPFAGKPIPFVALGQSSEILLGETVLNIGNPGGRGVVVTQGIISSTGQVLTNALHLATRRNDPTDRLVQFDAPSNGGNSGGALVDLRGLQVGVVSGGITAEEGTNYAVPIDVLREQLPAMLHAELRRKYVSGFTIDWQRLLPVIASIEPDSPASEAGLAVGDEIVAIDGRGDLTTIDLELTRLGWKPTQSVTISYRRDVEPPRETELKLARREPIPAVEVDSPSAGLLCRAKQLQRDQYDSNLPLAQPITSPPVVIPVPLATPPGLDHEDWYELSIDGYIQVDRDDVYHFELESDDGSRLYLHGEPVIENGDNHPSRTRSTWQYLAKGLHPIKIAYFEASGQQELSLRIGAGTRETKPVSSDHLFHTIEEP